MSAPTTAGPEAGVAPRRSLGTRLWYGYARVVVALRWPVIVGWVVAAIASAVLLPPLGASGDDLEQLGADDASLVAEQRSTEAFGFPLLSRVAIVQHDPDGMAPLSVHHRAFALGEEFGQIADGVAQGSAPVRGSAHSNAHRARAVPSDRDARMTGVAQGFSPASL